MSPIIPLKRCPRCGQEKLATTDYFAVNRRAPDGFTSRCKACQSEVGLEYRKRKKYAKLAGKEFVPKPIQIHPNTLQNIEAINAVAQERREEYLKSPSTCLQCGVPIPPKNGRVTAAKLREFCSRSCHTTYRNVHSVGHPKLRPRVRTCKCGNTFTGSNKRSCDECIAEYKQRTEKRIAYLVRLTKGEATRLLIQEHLRRYVSIPYEKQCLRCGYDKFTERCHIKSVSSFPSTATLAEINDPSNILILCPNCHKEFDNGLLRLEEILT